MQIQFKNNKFQTEIRNKHRQRMMTEIRRDLYHEQQINNSLQIHASQTLQNFLQHPTNIIPIEIVKHFESISFDENKFIDIIETQLDPFNLVNVLFAKKCIHHHKICLHNFCDKILDLPIQQFLHFDIIQIQGLIPTLKCSEEILLQFFCEYLANIPEKEMFKLGRIEKIKDFFLNYWNSKIDEKQLNFALSAKMASNLVTFHGGFISLVTFIKGTIVVLIEEDRSVQTYRLVKRAIFSDEDLAFFVVFNSHLPQFLYSGLDNELVFNEVFQIIQLSLQNPAYHQKLNLDFAHILKIMHSKYLSNHSTRFETYLLYGFYIIAESQLSGVKDFFCKIDYEEMLMKLYKSNLYDFLDLCLVTLYYFSSEQTIGKIMFGNKMKLLEIIDRQFSDKFTKFSYEIAQKISKVIEIWIEYQIEVPQLRNIIDDFIKILENVLLNQQKTNYEKQTNQIIDNLQQLLRKLTAND